VLYDLLWNPVHNKQVRLTAADSCRRAGSMCWRCGGVCYCVKREGRGASVGWHHVVTLMMCGPVSRVMVLDEVFMALRAAHDSMGCI
jgi:hypothetical protein